MKRFKDWPLIPVILLPFIYLAYIWKSLPDEVPIHWNINGEIDRYGDKTEVLFIPFLMPLLIYLIFILIPRIDPKKQIVQMGKKFDSLKFLLTTFMSILSIYLLYSIKQASMGDMKILILLMGLLFIILGNFMQTIKPNYFLGIRTPWTLESESIWKETHRLGGKVFLIGGFLIIASSIFLSSKFNLIMMIAILSILVFVPVIYSYVLYRKGAQV